MTEALGCNYCQQVFAVRESGFELEQLSGAYPYRRVWHWSGSRWYCAVPAPYPLPWIMLGLVLITVLIMFLHTSPLHRWYAWVVLMGLSLLLSVALPWLYRRRNF